MLDLFSVWGRDLGCNIRSATVTADVDAMNEPNFDALFNPDVGSAAAKPRG